MNAYVAGYSNRSLKSDADWTEKRRQEFLINPDIEFPKSVDSNVWEETVHSIADSAVGPVPLPVWHNLEELLAATAEKNSGADCAQLTIVVHVDLEIPEYVDALCLEPISGSVAGHLIGFDIADEGFISALSNCAYTADQMSYARSKYGVFINAHGLFDEIEIAHEFLNYSSIRIPEHTPFYVYSLYVDKKDRKAHT